MRIITNNALEEIISVAMKKGNVNGIIAATYFVENMYKCKPDITIPELIKGLKELEAGMVINNDQIN